MPGFFFGRRPRAAGVRGHCQFIPSEVSPMQLFEGRAAEAFEAWIKDFQNPEFLQFLKKRAGQEPVEPDEQDIEAAKELAKQNKLPNLCPSDLHKMALTFKWLRFHAEWTSPEGRN
jgi:hypothetical protein